MNDLPDSIDEPDRLTTNAVQAGRENAFTDANGSPNFVELGPCTITDAKRLGNTGENGAANESVKP